MKLLRRLLIAFGLASIPPAAMMAYLTPGGGVGQSDLCMPQHGYSFGDIPMSSGLYCTPDWANIIGTILSWTLVLFAPFAAILIATSLSDWFKWRTAGSDKEK